MNNRKQTITEIREPLSWGRTSFFTQPSQYRYQFPHTPYSVTTPIYNPSLSPFLIPVSPSPLTLHHVNSVISFSPHSHEFPLWNMFPPPLIHSWAYILCLIFCSLYPLFLSYYKPHKWAYSLLNTGLFVHVVVSWQNQPFIFIYGYETCNLFSKVQLPC